MIPHAIAACAVGVLVAGVSGYFYGRSDGANIERARQATAEDFARKSGEAAAAKAVEAIGKLEIKHVTIRQNAEREVIREPVYRDCVHTPDGLRSVNEALTSQPGNPYRDSGVPVPEPSGGPGVRSDNAEAH